jgi:hypothetical protein
MCVTEQGPRIKHMHASNYFLWQNCSLQGKN